MSDEVADSFDLRWGEELCWLEDDLCWEDLRCLPVDSDDAVASVSEGAAGEAGAVCGYLLEESQSVAQMCAADADVLVSVTSATDPFSVSLVLRGIERHLRSAGTRCVSTTQQKLLGEPFMFSMGDASREAVLVVDGVDDLDAVLEVLAQKLASDCLDHLSYLQQPKADIAADRSSSDPAPPSLFTSPLSGEPGSTPKLLKLVLGVSPHVARHHELCARTSAYVVQPVASPSLVLEKLLTRWGVEHPQPRVLMPACGVYSIFLSAVCVSRGLVQAAAHPLCAAHALFDTLKIGADEELAAFGSAALCALTRLTSATPHDVQGSDLVDDVDEYAARMALLKNRFLARGTTFGSHWVRSMFVALLLASASEPVVEDVLERAQSRGLSQLASIPSALPGQRVLFVYSPEFVTSPTWQVTLLSIGLRLGIYKLAYLVNAWKETDNLMLYQWLLQLLSRACSPMRKVSHHSALKQPSASDAEFTFATHGDVGRQVFWLLVRCDCLKSLLVVAQAGGGGKPDESQRVYPHMVRAVMSNIPTQCEMLNPLARFPELMLALKSMEDGGQIAAHCADLSLIAAKERPWASAHYAGVIASLYHHGLLSWDDSVGAQSAVLHQSKSSSKRVTAAYVLSLGTALALPQGVDQVSRTIISLLYGISDRSSLISGICLRALLSIFHTPCLHEERIKTGISVLAGIVANPSSPAGSKSELFGMAVANVNASINFSAWCLVNERPSLVALTPLLYCWSFVSGAEKESHLAGAVEILRRSADSTWSALRRVLGAEGSQYDDVEEAAIGFELMLDSFISCNLDLLQFLAERLYNEQMLVEARALRGVIWQEMLLVSPAEALLDELRASEGLTHSNRMLVLQCVAKRASPALLSDLLTWALEHGEWGEVMRAVMSTAKQQLMRSHDLVVVAPIFDALVELLAHTTELDICGDVLFVLRRVRPSGRIPVHVVLPCLEEIAAGNVRLDSQLQQHIAYCWELEACTRAGLLDVEHDQLDDLWALVTPMTAALIQLVLPTAYLLTVLPADVAKCAPFLRHCDTVIPSALLLPLIKEQPQYRHLLLELLGRSDVESLEDVLELLPDGAEAVTQALRNGAEVVPELHVQEHARLLVPVVRMPAVKALLVSQQETLLQEPNKYSIKLASHALREWPEEFPHLSAGLVRVAVTGNAALRRVALRKCTRLPFMALVQGLHALHEASRKRFDSLFARKRAVGANASLFRLYDDAASSHERVALIELLIRTCFEPAPETPLLPEVARLESQRQLVKVMAELLRSTDSFAVNELSMLLASYSHVMSDSMWSMLKEFHRERALVKKWMTYLKRHYDQKPVVEDEELLLILEGVSGALIKVDADIPQSYRLMSIAVVAVMRRRSKAYSEQMMQLALQTTNFCFSGLRAVKGSTEMREALGLVSSLLLLEFVDVEQAPEGWAKALLEYAKGLPHGAGRSILALMQEKLHVFLFE